MRTEIAIADVVEIVDKLKAEEKERCDRFAELNPVFKEQRERERWIYDSALHAVVSEIAKRM